MCTSLLFVACTPVSPLLRVDVELVEFDGDVSAVERINAPHCPTFEWEDDGSLTAIGTIDPAQSVVVLVSRTGPPLESEALIWSGTDRVDVRAFLDWNRVLHTTTETSVEFDQELQSLSPGLEVDFTYTVELRGDAGEETVVERHTFRELETARVNWADLGCF